MRSLARIMTGALAGSITALMAFTLLDYMLITGPAVMRGEAPETSPWLILSVSGAGAIVGGALTGSSGMVRMGGVTRDVTFGVLAGLAVVVALGLVLSSRHGPKRAVAEKARWLMYGVPAGALIGAAADAARGRARRGLPTDREADR